MIDLADRTTFVRTLPHGGTFIEVGVLRGDFSAIILAENYPSKLYLIDSWCAQPGTIWQEKDTAAKEDHDANYRHTLERFRDDPRVEVIKEFSVIAAERFVYQSIDIIYLDGDHTRAAEDVMAWWPRVKSGGWFCGHDYAWTTWSNIKPVIDRFTHEQRLYLYLTKDARDWPSWAIHKP